MDATFKSSIPTIWSLLIVLTTIIYSSMEEKTLKITCDYMKELRIPLNNEEYYIVHSTEVSLEYNPRLQITSFEKEQPVNIAFTQSMIHFEGNLYEYPESITVVQQGPQVVKVDINATILGIGTIKTEMWMEPSIDEIKQCRIIPLQTVTDNIKLLSFVDIIKERIITHTQLCAKRYLCEGSGYIEWKINKHVDKMLMEVKRYNALEKITLSEISKVVYLPLIDEKKSCDLHAWDGHFRHDQDLTRKNDAFLMKKRNIGILRANLEINNATMTYHNYTAICGDIVGNGNIKGEIKQLSLEILIMIDYSNNSCSIQWYIAVSNIEKILVTLNDLYPLPINSNLSKVLEYKWHNEDIKIIETSLVDTYKKYATKYICDNYSPAISLKK